MLRICPCETAHEYMKVEQLACILDVTIFSLCWPYISIYSLIGHTGIGNIFHEIASRHEPLLDFPSNPHFSLSTLFYSLFSLANY